MNSPHRFRQLFLLVSYLALSSPPFLPLLAGHDVPQAGRVLAAEVLLWAWVWALFGRPAHFQWLLIPAFLALPLELYFQIFFDQRLGAHQLGVLAETTSGEALEFMGRSAWGMLAVLAMVAAWWVLCFVAARHTDGLAWRGPTRWAFLAVTGALAAVTAHGYESQAPLAQMAGEVKFAESRPFGLVATFAGYYQERQEVARLSAGAETFRFAAGQQAPDGVPETVVLVLGESSRFDRWRLNGYARDTNPLLAKESNLVVLQDLVSPVTLTRASVPLIVTRKPAITAATPGFHEPSFVSAYKEAGFRTWWLSNQLAYGEWDSPFAPYSQEAHEVRHFNPGKINEQSSYDEVLLAPLQRALAAPAPRKLVVLHTLGSHWNYGLRYPAPFDRWQPSLASLSGPDPGDARLQRETSNSYDNSILYTDWFLAQVIGALKQSGQRAVLLYVSDHGELLRDAHCERFVHGQNTEFEFHVPGLVWYADQYRARYPDKVAALQQNRAARLGTPDIFHTVLDLGNIRYPGERLEWSFAQARYTPRARLVNTDDWVDYDQAQRNGACRVLSRPGHAGRQ